MRELEPLARDRGVSACNACMHACFCVGFAVGCLVSVASCHFCPVAWTRVAVMASDVYIEPNTLLLSRTRILRNNMASGGVLREASALRYAASEDPTLD